MYKLHGFPVFHGFKHTEMLICLCSTFLSSFKCCIFPLLAGNRQCRTRTWPDVRWLCLLVHEKADCMCANERSEVQCHSGADHTSEIGHSATSECPAVGLAWVARRYSEVLCLWDRRIIGPHDFQSVSAEHPTADSKCCHELISICKVRDFPLWWLWPRMVLMLLSCRCGLSVGESAALLAGRPPAGPPWGDSGFPLQGGGWFSPSSLLRCACVTYAAREPCTPWNVLSHYLPPLLPAMGVWKGNEIPFFYPGDLIIIQVPVFCIRMHGGGVRDLLAMPSVSIFPKLLPDFTLLRDNRVTFICCLPQWHFCPMFHGACLLVAIANFQGAPCGLSL